MPSEVTTLGKQPLKRVEVHLQNFNEVAIPYHVDLLKKHKSNITKYQEANDWSKVHHEQINATRSIKQLKAILSELDLLRNQVQDSDTDKFDRITTSARTNALEALDDFLAVKAKPTTPLTYNGELSINTEEDRHKGDKELEVKELDLQTTISEKLKQEKCQESWANLEVEIHDIHDLFQELARVVHDQKEQVDIVHDNIVNTKENVDQGTRSLRHISKLKASMYPLAGALVGGCLGGPVGLIAGIKLGGLAAVGCSILGFTGGRILKRKQDDLNKQEIEMTQVQSNIDSETSAVNKTT